VPTPRRATARTAKRGTVGGARTDMGDTMPSYTILRRRPTAREEIAALHAILRDLRTDVRGLRHMILATLRDLERVETPVDYRERQAGDVDLDGGTR
jgi:hypothetical protein